MLKGYLKTSVLILSVIGLLGLSLYGRSIPRDKDMYKRVGRYVVRPYRYGVYFTQPGTNVFYNFSPYDSYYVGSEGLEHRLVERGPSELFSEEFRQSQKTKSYLNKIYAVLSYFNYFDPPAAFVTSKGTTKIKTSSEGNVLNVYFDNYFADMPAQKVTMTLSLNPTDFVFDDSGNLYNTKTTDEILDFAKTASFPLRLYEFESPKRYIVGQTYLFIVNKEIPGAVRIPLNEPQYEVVYVNLEKQLIEFDMKNRENAKVKLELFDSLHEARDDI